MRYLVVKHSSGDKQTLRDLRHKILTRRTIRHPPFDVVPGLNVAPLREHAWLDSLADGGVKVAPNFYDCLQESIAPTHPIVIDLGDDSDSIATVMAYKESVYLHRNETISPDRITEDDNDTTAVNVRRYQCPSVLTGNWGKLSCGRE